MTPRLLVLDAAYSLAEIRARGIEHSVTSRDLDGFFEHVWSVHPLVGADLASGEAIGPIRSTDIDARNTFIEAHAGRYRILMPTRILNFLCSQIGLFVMLVRLMTRENVSLIRVGDPYYLGLMGYLLSRIGRVPLVIRVNGNYDAIYQRLGRLAYPRLFRKRKVEKWIDNFILVRAALVLAPNKNNLGFATDNGAAPGRAHVIPFGSLIDPVHFAEPSMRSSCRDELGIGDAPFIVCVGRLEPVKYPDDALAALSVARRAVPDLCLVFVGEGSMTDELESKAREQDLQDAIFFAGSRDQQWIASVMAEAVAVVAPMAGRALVEAFLSSTPVVAYATEWHPELINDGEDGLLVPFRNATRLGESVAKLAVDEPGSRSMGERARAKALTEMDPTQIRDKERQLYQAILIPSKP